MLTKVTVRNFKRFDLVEVELGNPVVFLGPNNSGKSTVMQALSLWETGLKRWTEKRAHAKNAETRPGVTLNRRDLVSVPAARANLLWKNLRVRQASHVGGRQSTANIRIEILVEGRALGTGWSCGLEFDYANEESFYCRPLRTGEGPEPARMPVPEEAGAVRTAFLAPITGLAQSETLLAPGAVDVRIGQGRIDEVLRNLCFHVFESDPESWDSVVERVRAIFGVALDAPLFLPQRGEITMSFREAGCRLDISSAGRGLHQTLLLLAFMHARPGSVLLLDEPDAHLEPLRQRQAYRTVREVAGDCGCQLIMATHSEVLLNEAADQDLALAFVGKPHRIGREYRERVSQALREIGFEHYLQAEQTGWVLYLRSPAELSALQALARRIGHDEAAAALQRPFVHYVADSRDAVERHFQSLVGVLPSVRGLAILGGPPGGADREGALPGLTDLWWLRGGIGAYVCTRSALESYALREGRKEAAGPLFAADQSERRLAAMREAISESGPALEVERDSTGAAADMLGTVFRVYRSRLREDERSPAPDAWDLVEDLPATEIDDEILEKLDAVATFAASAPGSPRGASGP